MNQTTEYPIPTTELRKGSIVTADTIEAAFGVKRETDAYRLAFRRLVDYVERRLRERGEAVTIVERKHDLVILTDDEASAYNARRFTNEIRGAARAHRRMSEVDRANVDPDRLPSHDRTLVTQGRVLVAAARARRGVEIAPVARNTPGKLGKGSGIPDSDPDAT